MIRISLDEPTLARTRITTSPLMEAVGSLYLLIRNPGEVPWPYTAWARRARPVYEDVPEVRPLRLFEEGGAVSPDFFSPFPRGPAPRIRRSASSATARAQRRRRPPSSGWSGR